MPSMDEFPYKSIYEYIEKHKLNDRDPEVLEMAKKRYWKEYRKVYDRTKKRTHGRVVACLERREFLELKDVCQRREVPLGHYAREAILLRLRQSVRMDEGTKHLLRVLSSMDIKLSKYLKNHGKVPSELPDLLLTIRDIEKIIYHLYDLSRSS